MVCSTQRTTEQLNHGLCSIGYPLPVTRQTAIKVQTSLEVLNPANRRDNWQYANCHDNWQCATEPFVWARVELYYTSPRLAKGWWGIYKHWTKQRSGVVESTYNFTPVYTTNRSLWLRNFFLGPFFGFLIYFHSIHCWPNIHWVLTDSCTRFPLIINAPGCFVTFINITL